MPQDYYLVLGIASDASQTDIKDAYRRLAKEYHPDHYKGNGRPFFPSPGPGDRQGTKDLNVMVALTPEQARKGGQIRITIPARPVCPRCGGRGWTGPYPCRQCDREGLLSGDITVTIHFPPEIKRGHQTTLLLDQYGMPGQHMTIHFTVKADHAWSNI